MIYKIQKVIGLYSKNKNGQEYRTQKGDTFKIGSINFEGDERQIKIFVWGNHTLEVGQEYEGEIIEELYNNKINYTFKGEQKIDKKDEEIAQLKFSLANAHNKIDEVVSYLKEKPWLKSPAPETTSKGEPMPDFDRK